MVRNNLYTDGSEFVLPDGTPYSGFYHVHNTIGAMVGARHIQGPHDRLTAVSTSASQKISRIQAQLNQQPAVATRASVSVSSSSGGSSSSSSY